MTKRNYIETNEAEDVAGSIRHVLRCAKLVSSDPQAWKWGLLTLHSALQGACVCHLTGTAAPLGAVTRANAEKWTKYFEDSRDNPDAKPPKTELMTLPDLLKAVRKPGSAGSHISNGGGRIEISDKEINWLKRLHDEIRNQFIHFQPMSWSIDVSGVPEFARTVARIIKDILAYGWAFRHLDNEKKSELASDLALLSKESRSV